MYAGAGCSLDPANLRVLCRSCNARRSRRSMDVSVLRRLLSGTPDALLTPRDAARRTLRDVSTIETWILSRELPVIRWRGGDLRRARGRKMIRRADLIVVLRAKGGA
jgi:hypothetical protein